MKQSLIIFTVLFIIIGLCIGLGYLLHKVGMRLATIAAWRRNQLDAQQQKNFDCEAGSLTSGMPTGPVPTVVGATVV